MMKSIFLSKKTLKAWVLTLVMLLSSLMSIQTVYAQTTITRPITASTDDAEEKVTGGTMGLTSSDLEMVLDGSNHQLLGFRFLNLTVPPGSVIISAKITFVAAPDLNNNRTTPINVLGIKQVNPTTFTATGADISSRPSTTASVAWTPGAWTTGNSYSTIDIKTVVQELIDQGGWASGNAMAFKISGPIGSSSDVTNAQSFDTNSGADAAILEVVYSSGPQADLSVTVSPATQTGNKGETKIYTVTITNAGPDVADNVTVCVNIPGNGTFVIANPSQGSYTESSKIWDVGSLAVGSKTLTITVKVN